MVNEIVNMMENRYDRDSLTLQIPKAFEYLTCKDADFEMVTSNTLQPLNLIYSHNLVTRTIAYIFINTGCSDVKYKNADERGRKAVELFQEVLGFEQIRTYTNMTKMAIIDELNAIQTKADEFNKQFNDKMSPTRLEKIMSEIPEKVETIFNDIVSS